MARSSVTLKQYMFEIRHEINQANKSNEFPDGLLFKWIHKDICEAILRLGALINNLYRTTATIAVASGAGHVDTSVDHVASATTVTGFSGLTPDAWIGGSIIAVVSNVIYAAQITDNDATTITISVGTDLPAMTTLPCILTANNSQTYIDISSLSMINYADPIWEVLESDGTPIEKTTLEMARNITNDPSYDNVTYWYQVSQQIHFAIGSSDSISGNITVGYYVLPTEATALTDTMDFPIEWHDLAQQRTMIRVLKKLGQIQRAQDKEVDLEKRWAEIDKANMNMLPVDQRMGERL